MLAAKENWSLDRCSNVVWRKKPANNSSALNERGLGGQQLQQIKTAELSTH